MTDYDSPLSRSCQSSQAGRDEQHHQARTSNAIQTTSRDVRPTRKSNKTESYFDFRRDAMMNSPTATLVADLSQNFHLGASPAVPTPRRSLMAQFALNEEDNAFHNMQEPVTPLEDEMHSSPGEVMDTSPLPVVCRRQMVRSISMFQPNSASATSVGSMLQRPRLQSRQPFSSFTMPKVPEKSTARKTLARGKENDDLADQFEESPKKMSVKQFHDPCLKSADTKMTNSSERRALLPVPTNTLHRRLPQFRRTQSMVTKNDEFLDPDSALQQTPRGVSAQRIDLTSPGTPEHHVRECEILPSFESKADQMRRINGLTLAKVLEGAFQHMYDQLVIIDCRFPHEYSGGHIPNAINISSLEAMDNHTLLMQPSMSKKLIILHCEYSAHRAPRIALHLRNRDRMMNAHRYPALFYPEMYILDGGYSLFFREHRHLVGSMGYVEMNDPTHKPFASKQMHDFRKHTKFARTHSYTFGQQVNVNLGGTSMQREDNFKFQRPSEAHAPQFLAALTRSQSALPFERNSEAQNNGGHLTEDDSFGDSSMMDIDDPCMTSPIPCSGTTSKSTIQTLFDSHSFQVNSRRLSSF